LSDKDKPCCAAQAASRLGHLTVGGHRIAIARLDEILEDARGAASGGERAVRDELVRLAKIYNYVPPPAEKAYEDALYSEYLAKDGKWKGDGGKGK